MRIPRRSRSRTPRPRPRSGGCCGAAARWGLVGVGVSSCVPSLSPHPCPESPPCPSHPHPLRVPLCPSSRCHLSPRHRMSPPCPSMARSQMSLCPCHRCPHISICPLVPLLSCGYSGPACPHSVPPFSPCAIPRAVPCLSRCALTVAVSPGRWRSGVGVCPQPGPGGGSRRHRAGPGGAEAAPQPAAPQHPGLPGQPGDGAVPVPGDRGRDPPAAAPAAAPPERGLGRAGGGLGAAAAADGAGVPGGLGARSPRAGTRRRLRGPRGRVEAGGAREGGGHQRGDPPPAPPVTPPGPRTPPSSATPPEGRGTPGQGTCGAWAASSGRSSMDPSPGRGLCAALASCPPGSSRPSRSWWPRIRGPGRARGRSWSGCSALEPSWPVPWCAPGSSSSTSRSGTPRSAGRSCRSCRLSWSPCRGPSGGTNCSRGCSRPWSWAAPMPVPCPRCCRWPRSWTPPSTRSESSPSSSGSSRPLSGACACACCSCSRSTLSSCLRPRWIPKFSPTSPTGSWTPTRPSVSRRSSPWCCWHPSWGRGAGGGSCPGCCCGCRGGTHALGPLRCNATLCLGRLAPHLPAQTRRRVLAPALARATRDPFPPARAAAVAAFAATHGCYSPPEVAARVLPPLCALTVDPHPGVRQQAFRAIRSFLEQLEAAAEAGGVQEGGEKLRGAKIGEGVQELGEGGEMKVWGKGRELGWGEEGGGTQGWFGGVSPPSP
uniref:Uncharacterized protein n=1 Tax=Geospiza parvula TaxID=87175 RepID=A0A8U8AW37_GEOPR